MKRVSGRRGLNRKRRQNKQYEQYLKGKLRASRSTRSKKDPIADIMSDEDSSDANICNSDTEWKPSSSAINICKQRKYVRCSSLYALSGDASDNEFNSDTEASSLDKFQFARELQQLDIQPSFQSQVLITIDFPSNFLASASLSDFKRLVRKNWFPEKSIVVLPRCSNGQIYICIGLKHKLHFTLGVNGLKKFLDIIKCCRKDIIVIIQGKGIISNSPTSSLHVEHYQGINKSFQLEEVMSYAKSSAMLWVPLLLNNDAMKNQRVDFSVDLGLTDQK